MDVKTIKVKDLIPYEKNPRRNDDAIDAVCESIKEFGFKVPLVISQDNVVITGHTRLKAAKKLGIKEVPCVIADDLSEAQIKAFRLVDNKTSELAEWDINLLDEEMGDLLEFNFTDYGFDFDSLEEKEDYHEEQKKIVQDRVANICDLGRGQLDGVGYYDIPEISPTYTLPEISEWIPFNCVLTDKHPQGKGVHFFIDDYQFERLWKNPDKYVNKLREYACVIAPDFSPYGDMPMVLQIYNHYRKHYIAKYLQIRGVTVIPCIRASTNPNSLDWYLDGEPIRSIVCISNMWTNNEEQKKAFKEEYETMYNALNPTKVLIYGEKETSDLKGDISYISSYAKSHYKR